MQRAEKAVPVVFLASKSFSRKISIENQPQFILNVFALFFCRWNVFRTDRKIFIRANKISTEASAKFTLGWEKFAVFFGPPTSAMTQLFSCLIIKRYLEESEMGSTRYRVGKVFDNEFLSDWTPVQRKTRLPKVNLSQFIGEGEIKLQSPANRSIAVNFGVNFCQAAWEIRQRPNISKREFISLGRRVGEALFVYLSVVSSAACYA